LSNVPIEPQCDQFCFRPFHIAASSNAA
jgi:hypothetical protein